MRPMRDLCRARSARVACLRDSLDGERFGIFGGLSQRERMVLRRHGEIDNGRDVVMFDRATGDVLVVPVEPIPDRAETLEAVRVHVAGSSAA